MPRVAPSELDRTTTGARAGPSTLYETAVALTDAPPSWSRCLPNSRGPLGHRAVGGQDVVDLGPGLADVGPAAQSRGVEAAALGQDIGQRATARASGAHRLGDELV